MEVNKEQAERCRDMGAQALRQGDYARAVKMFEKCLRLYELPGVDALLHQAKSKLNTTTGSSTPSASTSTNTANGSTPRSSATSSSTNAAGEDSAGRPYTDEQVKIVDKVLRSKRGGRGAHYRVLGIAETANASDIKKAYRKLSLKVHPDKNPAPHSDEAFKAVGLAYATLSDENKRTIYDRYGDEDPDNVGGNAGNPFNGMRRGGGGGAHMNGQHVNPEDIFNMFFHGGGGMGGQGVHFGGFGGPGVHFYGGGMPNMRQRQQGQQQQQQQQGGMSSLLQLIPLLLMLITVFLNNSSSGQSAGVGQYFSLTPEPPFIHELRTRYSSVKDIPFYVSGRFLRTYNRDRYQLNQVERMVENAYEQFLIGECRQQNNYKQKLHQDATRTQNPEEKRRKLKIAEDFELLRCNELYTFFPRRKPPQQR